MFVVQLSEGSCPKGKRIFHIYSLTGVPSLFVNSKDFEEIQVDPILRSCKLWIQFKYYLPNKLLWLTMLRENMLARKESTKLL